LAQHVAYAAGFLTAKAKSSDLNDDFAYVAPIIAYKTAAQSVTSSTTLVDDNDLYLIGEAGKVYAGELWAPYTGDTTGDIKFRFTFPTSDFLWGPMRLPVAATSTNAATPDWGGELITAGTNTATPTGGATSGLPILWIPFTWAPTDAGTLQFQWAQNVSSGTALTLQKYSRIMMWRIT
jgi:hypothetical protein